MSPCFQHNDYVIGWHKAHMRYQCGDVIVTEHPVYKTIIKRVIDVSEHKGLLLRDDNTLLSTTTTTLGWQPLTSVISKVLIRVPAK